MKQYTYLILNPVSGESQVLPSFPGFNPRARKAFQTLTGEGWTPVAHIPMGGLAKSKLAGVRVNTSVLVLLEYGS